MGQFGPSVTPKKFKAALLALGFSEVYEVALGADIGAISEAHHYAEKIHTGELPFLLTSCCPSWVALARNQFPDLIDSISQELTPMVATARKIKQEHPGAHVVFIGPCASKKLEASRTDVRSDVDFVITFEELVGMFEAKNIDIESFEGDSSFHDATGAGRGYAVAGRRMCSQRCGSLLEKNIIQIFLFISNMRKDWRKYKKILTLAKAGKLKNCMIEGMGCPGEAAWREPERSPIQNGVPN